MMSRISALNTESAAGLEQWLNRELRFLYSDDPVERIGAFRFDIPLPEGDSYLDRIAAMFERLEPPAQDLFRLALAAAFRHAAVDSVPAGAMTDILSMSAIARSFETLRAIPVVIGQGVWGERYPTLNYDAIAALALYPLSAEAFLATRELVTSAQFPDGLAFDAYMLMLRSDPRNWAADFRLVGPRFMRLKALVAGGDGAMMRAWDRRRSDLAQAFGNDVPMYCIASTLEECDPRSDAAFCWLLRLICGDDGPLRIIDEEPPVVSKRDDLAQRASFRLNEALGLVLQQMRLLCRPLRLSRPTRHVAQLQPWMDMFPERSVSVRK